MSEPEAVNLYDVETSPAEGRPAPFDRAKVSLGEMLGATKLGMSVYDLAPGQSTAPYHYEYGHEEWLLVISGTPTLRDPEDEYELAPGDLVVFEEGEEGAHQITNRTEEPARVAILSNKHEPAITVYPDSGKIGVWPLDKLFRLADEVDYFEGET